MSQQIQLDFPDYSLKAEVFDTKIGQKFLENLPREIQLIHWGDELYGPIQKSLGRENPVPEIPPGGLAYTDQGDYFCIFFGQTPAWPVDHIGKILGDEWKKLKSTTPTRVHVKRLTTL